jgi:hypothetical protein
LISGVGGLIYLKETRVLKLKVGLGQGKNNFVELMALKLFLTSEK